MKILVVEDDYLLNKTLCFQLKKENFEVDPALNVKSAIDLYHTNAYDLAILDINLPDGNGFDLCQQLKLEQPRVSVLFLTANDIERDMLRGYDLGAEDYVTKPFPLTVLMKKIELLNARLNDHMLEDLYEDQDISINFSTFKTTVNGQPITLTSMEYKILKLFITNTKIVLTRQMLLEQLWDADGNFVESHALTASISRIRSKIEKNHIYIKTIYGMGYMWIGGENT